MATYDRNSHSRFSKSEEPMKKGILAAFIILVVVAGVIMAIRIRTTADLTAAATAESKGDYKAALTWYCKALNSLFPAQAVPDVNHSKVIPPASWKREMENYAAWISGSSAATIDRSKRDAVCAAVNRNASRVHAENYLSNPSSKRISIEEYRALWNSAYFAPNVAVDSNHASIAASCFGKAVSIIRFSAHTSYTYEISLIDTSACRSTTFSVYPENSTYVLALPGTHLLICKSIYQPSQTQIWRSEPSFIVVTVPATPSLVSFTLETMVLREKPGNDGL
jgi:hypothetical protein